MREIVIRIGIFFIIKELTALLLKRLCRKNGQNILYFGNDPLIFIIICGDPAISLHSYHVSLVQWTTSLLPVTRDPGSKPLGEIM
jgi:hypothetical protein